MWWIKRLISRSPTYKELQKISAGENNEKLVDVRKFNGQIFAEYRDANMQAYFGNVIFVREEVAKKLGKIQEILNGRYGYGLFVTDGYRHPNVQEMYFEKQRAILLQSNPKLTPAELDQATHAFIAVPLVAGHPTGGAVDLTLVDKIGFNLDMGTDIANFDDASKIKTFAKNLTGVQRKNRRILLDVMLELDFVPFYGEWWHFSYGDREWAWNKKRRQSIYSPINFRLK